LVTALNAMSARLREMVASIHESAEQVAASSEEITANALKLAEGAQSQASTLEETSASVEELTASVDQVAGHAQSQAAAVEQGSASMAQVHQSIEAVSKNLEEIAALAGKSVENALQGAKAVSEVVEGINLIAGSSERIGGIIAVISDIADQTNLLALNASIEAARAGEHGRGFAVVADEVSKLADRSSTSTKEIEALIRESVKNVTKGVETARGSQAAMEQIRGASQKVKEMIGGLSDSMTQQVGAVKELARALENVSEMSQSISAATEEQTTNAKQVSTAVENVNDVTQSAASAAEEMSASTEQLSGMASALQRMMGQFKITGEGEARVVLPRAQQRLGATGSVKAGVLDAEQIGMAIGAHGTWKLRLKEAIHTGRSQMEVATVRVDDKCAFGKWLYGLPEAARKSETAVKVRTLHAEFHEVVGHIMEMALAGKRAEAEKEMQRGSRFASLSNELTRIMMEWKDSLLRTEDEAREPVKTR
ncbi:MAG: methyl-accepting chemotaxis protein, partial [Spirochaetia bacterium]